MNWNPRTEKSATTCRSFWMPRVSVAKPKRFSLQSSKRAMNLPIRARQGNCSDTGKRAGVWRGRLSEATTSLQSLLCRQSRRLAEHKPCKTDQAKQEDRNRVWFRGRQRIKERRIEADRDGPIDEIGA